MHMFITAVPIFKLLVQEKCSSWGIHTVTPTEHPQGKILQISEQLKATSLAILISKHLLCDVFKESFTLILS